MGGLSMMAKRVFDILAASAALLLLWPLLLLIAILVKTGSSGPILYRGERTGRYGKPFHILKFRSMVVEAERLGGYSTAQNDPRVTRIGRFLRRFKLDELPQLFNVLRGEMSIVGPRPEVPAYTRLYVGEELLILTVLPGITDYSSIKFSQLDKTLGTEAPDRVYEEIVLPDKNLLRLKYVETQTFWGDMGIIISTMACVAGDVLGWRRRMDIRGA